MFLSRTERQALDFVKRELGLPNASDEMALTLLKQDIRANGPQPMDDEARAMADTGVVRHMQRRANARDGVDTDEDEETEESGMSKPGSLAAKMIEKQKRDAALNARKFGG